ncbi:hypothetical protein Goklo_002692 [Gossypium klotzschianum]|uniref:DUF7745 domain-containing protein n=1 Tax=Gossypium klotzschianum TaxID=34286 RepID=A0A7J8VU19_9ROSI|nr:hypothetical protein [Gossypium klotzschianum]
MNTLQEDSVVRHGVENIGVIARMSEDTQSKEGDFQIASFDLSLPQIVRMDCRRNCEDEDVMGKASSDRHLALFAFVVYGLVMFLKALGYVSVELANFLSQIEKGVNPAPVVLVETIISLNFIRRKGDEHFLGCTQLLFLWMKSNFWCVIIPSTRPIEEFLEIECPLNQSIEELVQNLSTLTYQEIECFGSGLEILEEMGRDTNQVGSKLELAIRNLFQPFPLENVYLVEPRKTKISMSVQFKGKRKVRDDVAELTEKMLNLEMHLSGRDEQFRWQREQHQAYVKEKEAKIMRQ